MDTIIDYLNKYGQKMDTEIAAGTGLSLATVKKRLNELSANGAVISCQVIRFSEGRQIEGMISRVAGYVPKVSGGRTPKVQISI